MRVPLVDLKAQHATIRDEVMAAAEAVIASQAFILGEPVARFEATLARACGAPHAIGVASGTDALVLSLRAVGVGAGDAVITTAFTFVATAEAIVRVGARPVFADVDPRTMTLAPASVDAAIARAPRAKAIVPVHLFGQCADMAAIGAIARARGLRVVEDAAQAIGARDAGAGDDAPRIVGALGDAAAHSFFPSKNLGAWGDAGAVTTGDAAIDARVRRLRAHGAAVRGESYVEIGMNSRLDALHAAVLDVKARRLEAWTEARRRAAARYRELLAPVASRVALPEERAGARHVYNQFVVRTPDRDALARFLGAHGVATRAYYPVPLHRQPCFEGLHDTPPLPATDDAARTALALPMYAEITPEQQAYVAERIAAFFG